MSEPKTSLPLHCSSHQLRPQPLWFPSFPCNVSPRRGSEGRACCWDRTSWRGLRSSKPSSHLGYMVKTRLDSRMAPKGASTAHTDGWQEDFDITTGDQLADVCQKSRRQKISWVSRPYLRIAAASVLEQRPPESALVCDLLAYTSKRGLVVDRCHLPMPNLSATPGRYHTGSTANLVTASSP